MNIERAIEIAVQAHKGQKDKGGNPYILHPLWVMNQMETEDEKIVAVLHDVLEDSTITSHSLLSEGFELKLVEQIELLTHDNKIPYEQYIEDLIFRCDTSYPNFEIARNVKIKDLEHNMKILRLKRPMDHNDLKHLNKYVEAWHKLKEV